MIPATRTQSVIASAPAKVILLGEHAVNRHQPAIAAATALRAEVRIDVHDGEGYHLRSGERSEHGAGDELQAFRARIEKLRAEGAIDDLAALAAHDFFAPLRYVLALIDARLGLLPLDITIRSEIPIGAGLGSGAAVASALAVAATTMAGASLDQHAAADLAWLADTIAHGGVASALDASACALGGVVRYELAGGGRRLDDAEPLTLVVGDTCVAASTAAVNAGVRKLLDGTPTLSHLFVEIGLLAEDAAAAIEAGELDRLGHLMNLNQLVLERIGVSSPEIDALVTAALAAGALGAKLSGSGGGGIVVALAEPGRSAEIARAIERAGGRAFVTGVARTGVQLEALPFPSRL